MGLVDNEIYRKLGILSCLARALRQSIVMAIIRDTSDPRMRPVVPLVPIRWPGDWVVIKPRICTVSTEAREVPAFRERTYCLHRQRDDRQQALL